MKIYNNIFNSIISLESLFEAWRVFKSDKRNKPDVAGFERELETHIFQLYRDLHNSSYVHRAYKAFWLRDPKPRRIHKATVRDRILHHSIFAALYPIFERGFISTSFSCRIGKGTHRGVVYVRNAVRKVSRNYTRPCFVLKCDVRKFFDTVDQAVLITIIKRRLKDEDTMSLLENIISSYSNDVNKRERESTLVPRKGIPIGNLTSQLFANIYMNEFDQFVKHELKVKYYARYTDDFVVVSNNESYLKRLLPQFQVFLREKLLLELHPKKIEIQKYNRGIDFLGYVILPYHIKVRTKTRHRMFRNLKYQAKRFKAGDTSDSTLRGSLNSYLGVLSHANAYEMEKKLLNQLWYWITE